MEDCAAAYRELVEQGEAPESITVVGDSAGGAMSVTTAVSARKHGVPVPACVVCFSPGGNALRSGGSLDSRRDKDPFFTEEALKASGERYLQGADPHEELASPISRADLTGFPPLLVQVGGDEILLDDSVLLAERAREADVDVVLDITAGVPHVFQAFVDQLDEAGQALDRAALFVMQHVSRG